MMKNEKIKGILLLLFTVFNFIFLFSVVIATEVNLGYPAFAEAGDPADFIRKLYIYALSISGTLAVVMIVSGGVKYIASAGNTSMQADAKDIIKNAIYGILLLGAASLILNTINPKITSLDLPSITKVPTASNSSGYASCFEGQISTCKDKLRMCIERHGYGKRICQDIYANCEIRARNQCAGGGSSDASDGGDSQQECSGGRVYVDGECRCAEGFIWNSTLQQCIEDLRT